MARPRDYEIATALQKLKGSKAFRDAATELDFVAVCMIGYERPVPVEIGSNATHWPVKFTTSRDPSTAAKRADLEQPLHALVCLEYVWTLSDAHARRLKGALDTMLLGNDADMMTLRHSWRDCSDPAVAWGVLLSDALRSLREKGQTIETFSEEMKVQRILNHARKGLR